MSRGDNDARAATPATPSAYSGLSPDRRERFQALGADRFTDREYQQWARGHRTTESLQASGRAGWQALIEVHGREILSRAGKLGWAATVARYGEEFAWDRAAESRRDRPTAPERAMIALLAELGQRDGVDYGREVKVAPRTHVDFAWADERRAVVEVYGGVHFGPFDADGARSAYDAARVARIEALGWRVLVVTSTDLRAGNRDATRDRVRDFIQANPAPRADGSWDMFRRMRDSATQLLQLRR